MLNFKIYHDINIKPPIKTKEKKDLIEKVTKLSELENGKITPLKRVRKSLREISKTKHAVKVLSAITWKVQISMEQENRLASHKNYHYNSREELFAK